MNFEQVSHTVPPEHLTFLLRQPSQAREVRDCLVELESVVLLLRLRVSVGDGGCDVLENIREVVERQNQGRNGKVS